MIHTDKRLRVAKLLLVCLLVFVWGNSLLPGEVSGALSDWVRSLLDAILPGSAKTAAGRGLLRKIAHFTEFTALGMTLGWISGMLKKKGYWALLSGVTVACLDEIIQHFVPDRGPSLRDVLIDSCGVLTGLVLLRIGYALLRKLRAKRMDNGTDAR